MITIPMNYSQLGGNVDFTNSSQFTNTNEQNAKIIADFLVVYQTKKL
ncbi:hypothetical protein MCCPILRI181_00180 [Mycoplasma capricolum subsp. capripneumoniae]|nr:hypothetical protein Mccp14020TZ_01800 [Mycoplasma capricolum subsp. capripneumoniae]CEA10548.1 hypothetical protein MCCPILRI181_00180 [Mycoplasma capricolum subsp. capripneumoniae]